MSAIAQNRQGIKVLAAGSAMQLLLGILYVWSVFVNPVSKAYLWEIESVKLTSSFMLCFFVAGILAGGKFQMKAGTQKVVLTGGLMLAAGMFATANVPAPFARLIYVTYGIIGGFGVGAAYNAIITSAQKWFPDNRGFATGVTVCAFGFSTVVFAPLIEALVSVSGVRNTFFILSAIFGAASLALFRFIRMPEETLGAETRTAAQDGKRQYGTAEAIRTREFYFITLSLMFATAAFFILNPSFKTLASQRGLGESAGTAVVMLTGVANALGRLGAPLLSDKIGREKAAFANIAATSVCVLLLCFVNGYAIMALIAVIAFNYGGYSGMYPVLTADYFGIKNVGSNYGAVMIGFAVSALTFPALIGLIGDMTAKFAVLSVLAAAGAVLVMLPLVRKKGGAN